MKIIFKLFILLAVTTLFSCTTSSFHRTDAENSWLITQTNILGIYTFSDIFYCSSNKVAEKSTMPICSKAAMLDKWNSIQYTPKPEDKK